MFNYGTKFAGLGTGVFPNFAAKNASGPTATDGFPFTADSVNDWIGFTQDLLNRAGLTPNGQAEANGSSQLVKALMHLINIGLPVGAFFEQYPDAPTPVEAGWPGTWEVWSSRAVIYGLRSTNSGSASIYIERQKCGNPLTAADLTVGAQVSSGAYAGYYVREVVTLAGKFTGIEGGNRPTFISGGRQDGRIRNFPGSYTARSLTRAPTNEPSLTIVSGPFGASRVGSGSILQQADTDGLSTSFNTIDFDPSIVVPTGPDNAPTNLSKRVWRRTS
jgi:hypothetical protein